MNDSQEPDPRPLRYRPASLSLYVHLPFCASKCWYCDFNAGVAEPAARQRYLHALQREIESSPWQGVPCEALLIGGGSPSALEIRQLEPILTSVTNRFPFSEEAEVTLECNPEDATPPKLSAWRSFGINRLSLGVQSFQDHHLKALGRRHAAIDAIMACRLAREAGFKNLNLDLLYGLPEQTMTEWAANLREAIRLRPEHLSLYGLSVDAKASSRRPENAGALSGFDEETASRMFELALEEAVRAGYGQYEICHFSLPGFAGRYNLSCWSRKPLLGFGTGAASCMNGVRWTNAAGWSDFCESCLRHGVSTFSAERLDPGQQAVETVILALRTTAGISLDNAERPGNCAVDRRFKDLFHEWAQMGLAEVDAAVVRLTPAGQLVSSALFAQILERAPAEKPQAVPHASEAPRREP